MKPIKILIVTGNLEVPGTVGNHLAAITEEELLALTVRTPTVNSQWTDVQHLHLADALQLEQNLAFWSELVAILMMKTERSGTLNLEQADNVMSQLCFGWRKERREPTTFMMQWLPINSVLHHY